MYLTYRRSCIPFALIALFLFGLALSLGPSPSALAADHSPKHVYILNNNVSGANSITTFNRADDGSLSPRDTISIGGMGGLPAFSDGTQGSLILAHKGRKTRLFAVDAGSNQISVVKVHSTYLSLAGVFPSGGVGPVSLTYKNGWLYVLNAANGSNEAANVTGFRLDSKDMLQPIAGSTKPLSAAHPNPAQIQIDPSGQFLVVTEKGTNLIDVYSIHSDGSLSGPSTFAAVGVYPFGMAFNPKAGQQFVVANGMGGPNMTGGATAYVLMGGNVHLINGPVLNAQIAPCWMVITGDGQFAYTSNADSQSISGYRIQENGTISLLNANGVTATTPSDTFPIEESLSSNGQFLYVLDSRLLLKTPGPATLSGFLIHSDGSLTSVVNEAQITLPFSTIGLAAE